MHKSITAGWLGNSTRTVTIVGGHHPTICPQDFDDEAVEIVSIGEGVGTIRELIEVMAGSKELSQLRALPTGKRQAQI
jgi:radical SAM superfamily enzyme YgiQ (UPF0313 family)